MVRGLEEHQGVADVFTYRCVPLPVQQTRGADVDRSAAVLLYTHIEAQMKDGFEFHGSHTVYTWQASGCLGWLFGPTRTLYTTTVLVFRRLENM